MPHLPTTSSPQSLRLSAAFTSKLLLPSKASKACYRVLSGCAFRALQLPSSFFAYRKQQHRWTCGPVQLWRRCAKDIWGSSLPLSAKLELLVLYFGVRKFATHWVSLGFFCTLVPLSIFTPEVRACCHHAPLRVHGLGAMRMCAMRWVLAGFLRALEPDLQLPTGAGD